MVISRSHELAALRDGETVEIVGRYDVVQVDLRPPHEEVVTARVFLEGGMGVMVGGYHTPEAIRPREERERLRGKRVRLCGMYRPTMPFLGTGPMPGLWVGGGPQVVELTSLELVGE